jgi:hypothetical protein
MPFRKCFAIATAVISLCTRCKSGRKFRRNVGGGNGRAHIKCDQDRGEDAHVSNMRHGSRI